MSTHGWHQSRALVALAVGYQWLYNGANFVAFKAGGDAIPPLLLAAMRFALAGLLLMPFGWWRWRSHPARLSELAAAAALGVVMLVGSQTLAIVGTHLLSAGVASVFASAAPIFLALFSWCGKLGSECTFSWRPLWKVDSDLCFPLSSAFLFPGQVALMKCLRFVLLATFALCGVVQAADTSCVSALDAASSTPMRRLPDACASVGPLRLGMGHAEMIRTLGAPDMDTTGRARASIVVYVFPRDLAARLAARPVAPANLHHTDMYVVFREGHIVAIQVEADPQASFPYALGDVAFNGSIDVLLGLIRAPLVWNASKDDVRLLPYPMDIEVDPDTRQIVGATIAADARAMQMIPRPRFHLLKNPVTGFISGYRVSMGG